MTPAELAELARLEAVATPGRGLAAAMVLTSMVVQGSSIPSAT